MLRYRQTCIRSKKSWWLSFNYCKNKTKKNNNDSNKINNNSNKKNKANSCPGILEESIKSWQVNFLTELVALKRKGYRQKNERC